MIRRKRIFAMICAAMMFAGCGNAQKDERFTVAENEVTNEDKLLNAIRGWKDSFKVEQGINPKVLTHYLEYDTDIIKSIEADDSKVDWNTPGSYTATYKITYVVPETTESEVHEGSETVDSKEADESNEGKVATSETIAKTATHEESNAEEIQKENAEAVETGNSEASSTQNESESSEASSTETVEDEKTDTVEVDVPVDVLTEEEVKDEKEKGEDVIGKDEFEEELKKDEASSETSKEETKEEPKNEESKDSEKETPKTEDKKDTPATKDENKPSTPSAGEATSKPSTPSTGGNTSKPTTPTQPEKTPDPEPSKPAQPQHTHTWVEQFTPVNHPEQGHYVTVVDQAAWTEEVPIYEARPHDICNHCGEDITVVTYKVHFKTHPECRAYHLEWISEQVGTETVYHEEVSHQEYVVDQVAWTEQVSNGYLCSGCGARK